MANAIKKPPIDNRDNFQIISEELTKFGGPQKNTSNSRFVCCPFHSDGSPSCSVYMSNEEHGIPLGFFFCFGCGTKGRWNEFAEKASLQKIKEWRKSESISSDTLVSKEIEEKLLGSDSLTFKAVLRNMGCEEAIRWPVHLDWRGFSGSLIHRVGGHIIDDPRNDDVALLFPIKIRGKVRGGVKAVRERKSKKQLGYITMSGAWVKDYGLFPFMHVQRILHKTNYDFVCLVEGPRDALRLVSMGIPALAILGANSMSDVKVRILAGLHVSLAYVISDNDEGGTAMWKVVKRSIRKGDQMEVRRIKLPEELDDKGKLIKMDPGNMPPNIANRIIKILKERHGFKRIDK